MIVRFVLKDSRCGWFTMTTKSVIFLILSSLSFGASSSFRKCCRPGEVFSGVSKVDCVPAPEQATELYIADLGVENVTYDGFPICEKPQDISTIPLVELNPTDFLQKSSCLEILHEQSTQQSVPIVVHCQSNKDRAPLDTYDLKAASLPRLLDVRRCCSNNTVFNVRTGSCEPLYDDFENNSSRVDEFSSLLPKELETWDFLNVHKGMTKCSGAIFTYEINVEDVTFVDGALKVTLPSRKNTTERFTINDANSCLELTPDFRKRRQLVVRVCRSMEFCQDHGCITKCCAEGEYYYKSRCTKIQALQSVMDFNEGVSNFTRRLWNSTEYGLLFGLSCPDGAYPLRPNEIHGMTPEGYVKADPGNELLQHDQYCMEVFNNRLGVESLSTFVCFEPLPEETVPTSRYMVASILQGISCFFLLLTLIVYGCLPVLQNLHGKTLMCHAASLLMAYACLCIIPWVTPEKHTKEDEYATMFCSALGFTMLFSFLSAFCWLNVMCFDIWRTFGRLRGNISRGRSHGKKFLSYCLYAWGLSMFITVFGILTDTMHILPENLRPDFGSMSCWFAELPGLYGELVFFRGPVAIQLTSNVVFFILTAEQCSKVKAEISRVADPLDPRSKRFHADKTKLIMNVKLFIVMGISWIAEIISSFVNQYTSHKWREEIFYATDVLNCLQGLLIFLLFVMKRRVHLALKKRLGFDSKKKCSSHGTSMLQDPFKVRKSASNSTLTSSFAVSVAP